MATADFSQSGPQMIDAPPGHSDPVVDDHSFKLAAIALVAAHAPMVIVQLYRTWQLPRYQFGPLLIAMIVTFAWQRSRRDIPGTDNFGTRAGIPILLLGLAMLSASALLHSPWVATAALLINIAGLLIHTSGLNGFRRYSDLWLLSWLAIPLPMKSDTRLIGWLQLMTSRAASGVLDLMGIEHRLAGNIFYIPGQQLFVDEACSGVQSLFGTLACVGLYCIWSRFSIVRSLVLIAAVWVWVPVVNALRVLAVVHVNSTTNYDLSVGWPHDMLAVVLFPITLFLIFATDRVTGWIWEPIPEMENKWADGWNRLIAAGTHAEEPESAQDTLSDTPSKDTASRLIPRLPSLVLSGFLAVGSFQLILMGFGRFATSSMNLSERPMFAESMPETVEDWRRADFRTVHRERGSDEGEFSQEWIYGTPRGAAIVSWDHPFIGWHELTQCYQGRGWKVLDRIRHDDDVVELVLRNSSGEFAWVAFTLLDTQGAQLEAPTASVANLLANRLASEVQTLEWSDTTYQLQLYQKMSLEPTTEDRNDLNSKYRGFLKHMQGNLANGETTEVMP